MLKQGMHHVLHQICSKHGVDCAAGGGAISHDQLKSIPVDHPGSPHKGDNSGEASHRP